MVEYRPPESVRERQSQVFIRVQDRLHVGRHPHKVEVDAAELRGQDGLISEADRFRGTPDYDEGQVETLRIRWEKVLFVSDGHGGRESGYDALSEARRRTLSLFEELSPGFDVEPGTAPDEF